MPYCRDCGRKIYGKNTYCSSCEEDIIERSRDSIESASDAEQRRMRNDKNYAHSWLQDAIGWIIGLIKIIDKIWGSGCYVTSALVIHKGLNDDCVQMRKFRKFRQEFILNSNNKEKLIDLQEYYIQGQILVRWIESRKDSTLIWKYVESYINEFTEMLDKEDFDKAYCYFKYKTLKLQKDVFYEKHKQN